MSDPSKPSPPPTDNASAAVVSAEAATASALAAASLATTPRRDMRYINVLASLLAVFVSLVSLWLAYRSNRTQERMLAASSWPYLRFGSGNLTEDGVPMIRLMLRNGGSGPAVLHWLRLHADGRDLRKDVELLEWAAPGSRNLTTWTASTTNVPLAPGEFLYPLQLGRTEENEAAWQALNEARWRLDVEGCYCSLVDDCWIFRGEGVPTPVAACPAPPPGAWRS